MKNIYTLISPGGLKVSSKKSFLILLIIIFTGSVSVTANAVVVTVPGYTVEIYATYSDIRTRRGKWPLTTTAICM